MLTNKYIKFSHAGMCNFVPRAPILTRHFKLMKSLDLAALLSHLFNRNSQHLLLPFEIGLYIYYFKCVQLLCREPLLTYMKIK